MRLYSLLPVVPGLLAGLLLPAGLRADPWAMAGDMGFRHDVQVLADAGVVLSPVTAWPIPWATLAADLEDNAPGQSAPLTVRSAFVRVSNRLQAVRQADGIQLNTRLAGSPSSSSSSSSFSFSSF